MPKYVIKSFRDSVSDYEDKGIAGAFKFGANCDIRKNVDSLSCTQALVDEGLLDSRSPSASVSPSSSVSLSISLSPSASSSPTPSPSASQSPSSSISSSPSATPSASISPSPSASTALTSVFRDLIKKFVLAIDGYTYGVGDTGYIYRRDTDAYWTRVYKDENGEIKGASEWYSDTGKVYLYFATDKVLKRKPLPGRSDWNDVEVVGSDLTSAESHDMREAGGSLIIANGPGLALVGYDDSYTSNALDLIPGNIAKTITERNGRSIIGTARAANLTRGVNGAIDAEYPLAQVGDEGELFYSDMSSSMVTKSFPGGGKVNPGGVANEIDQVNFFEWEQTALSWIDKQSVGNMALFAVYGADTGKGGIYTYGRRKKNHPFVLNLEHQLDADELGAIVNIAGVTLVSYRDGVDCGVMAVDPDNKATAIFEGLDLPAPVKESSEITTWKTAELSCKPLVNGTSLEFWYRVNKDGDFIQAKMEGGDVRFTAEGERKAVFLIQAEGDIFEPRVVLNPTGNISPEVYKIIINFV